MAIFSTIKSNIRTNLANENVFYSTTDVDDSVQDAYDDIIALSQCRVKKVTLSWLANLVYYDFKNNPSLAITDFMAVTAIYNNVTKQWLIDNVNLKQLDQIRMDWELWNGTPQFWVPVNYQYAAIVPSYPNVPSGGTFDLYYWALAPAVIDAEVPLIAADAQDLLENYSTGDLLEQAQEYTKASIFWKNYFEGIDDYSVRVQNIARSDFLLLA